MNLVSKFCHYVRISFIFLLKGKSKLLSIFHSPWLSVRLQDQPIKAVKLLNGFGHCVSYSSVLALDTALATANLNNPSLVPKSIEPGTFTITVWDNCDFLKETESGKGTTHIVNGIQIQTKENPTKSNSRITKVGHLFQSVISVH